LGRIQGDASTVGHLHGFNHLFYCRNKIGFWILGLELCVWKIFPFGHEINNGLVEFIIFFH